MSFFFIIMASLFFAVYNYMVYTNQPRTNWWHIFQILSVALYLLSGSLFRDHWINMISSGKNIYHRYSELVAWLCVAIATYILLLHSLLYW